MYSLKNLFVITPTFELLVQDVYVTGFQPLPSSPLLTFPQAQGPLCTLYGLKTRMLDVGGVKFPTAIHFFYNSTYTFLALL